MLNFFSEDGSIASFNSLMLPNGKFSPASFFIKNYFEYQISQIAPIFSYFIYSVDKNIRKYSRGKSGKYTFVWKYVAPYKRLFVSFRWILKDIKFNPSKTFDQRIMDTLTLLILNPEKSFAWKSKTYSYNYVFKNFKKTLMSSLKTTIK